MKTYSLLLPCLFLFFYCSSLSAQVPFQGQVTSNVMPIKDAYIQNDIQVLYHTSFDGNLKVFLNNELIFDRNVQKDVTETLNMGGDILYKQRAVMKIVIDDIFFHEEFIYFHHPYVRINYRKDQRQLTVYHENNLPSAEDIQQDLLEEQVLLAIREQMTAKR